MFKAAVIGLGNIGFFFDLDPLRKETWSHVSAYTKCLKTELVGVVDVDKEKVNIFKQHHDVLTSESIEELLESTTVDIVSICTPTEEHYDILKKLIKYPVKAIFCEKPIASDVCQAKEMVRLCKEKNIVFAVNHTRRWDSNYQFAKNMIEKGKIGNVKAVNAVYPSQLFNVGTHLLDTVRMLVQKDPKTLSGVASNIDAQDPDVSGWIEFDGPIPCTVISTGKREDLIFEIDVIGDEGRIRILENGVKIEWYAFVESTRYSGYRELSLMQMDPIQKNDRFVEAIYDIVSITASEKSEVSCTGNDGFYSLAMGIAMLESARENGIPVSVEWNDAL
jgi:predicted dehydrogenase